MEINTDKMVEILKNDKPLTVFNIEEFGKVKMTAMFVLPELSEKVQQFAKSLLLEIEA